MKECSGPQSGLREDDGLEKSDIVKPVKHAKRVGATVQFYDAEGEFQGTMRVEEFDAIKEDLEK